MRLFNQDQTPLSSPRRENLTNFFESDTFRDIRAIAMSKMASNLCGVAENANLTALDVLATGRLSDEAAELIRQNARLANFLQVLDEIRNENRQQSPVIVQKLTIEE